jgi:group I intron endonuclease
MLFIFHEKANMAGVYKIVNLLNGRIYIGSTYRFKSRAHGHKTKLGFNQHENQFLQHDFNKCGTDAFLFEVLEVINGNKEARTDREQYFIDQFYDNQKNCYNLVPYAVDNRGGTHNKEEVDPSTDKRCQPHTTEHKNKISITGKETWQDPVLKEQASRFANKRWSNTEFQQYTFTNSITGETITTDCCLRQWCQERHYSYTAFNQLVHGKIKSSAGWYVGVIPPTYIDRKGEKHKPLSQEHRNKIANNKYTGIVLVNDKGEELVIACNVKEQAAQLNISYTTLLKVLKGICKSVNGWKLPIK